MVKNNSTNLDVTINTVGVTVGGGSTTERFLTINGSGNTTLTAQTNGTFTLPNQATDTLLGAALYTAAGTLLYGSGAGTVPSTLAAGTAGQVLVSTGAGVVWGSTGLQWTGISAPQTAVAGSGYYVTTGNQAVTLPATAAAGTVIGLVAAKGSTGWSIVQGAGQSIQFGSISTTTGAGGSLASTAVGDAIYILYTTANTTWVVLNSVGNITIV